MNEKTQDLFPDGSPIDDWFFQTDIPTLESLGKPYVITDHGVADDGKIHTRALQDLIDHIAENGGGVMVIPAGTYYTGALFFKQGVHLYVSENGMLKGSDDISDYPVCKTRIEGECCMYYPALINADGIDGFVMCGKGTIDGNGLRAWKAFWQRRQWNPACTNKDEQRPRLVFISNCKNVWVADLHLQNSPFWTNHIYKCQRVKFIGCHIFAPKEPVMAPSSDAIDIDVCTNVLVKNCYMEVNDDSIVLKGGKGPWADTDEGNGANERILVEDCHYGFCHGGLTCGSESVYNRNVLVRRIQVEDILQLICFKLRPDTPQHYEYITIENVTGSILQSFININPWMQFFDLKGRTDKPVSRVNDVTIRDCNCTCGLFFNVKKDEKQYTLSRFNLQNLQITTANKGSALSVIDEVQAENVEINEIAQ